MDENSLCIVLPEEDNYKLPSPSLLNFYRDLKERVYWVNEEIGDETLDLVQYILQWNREDKGIPVEERKPIKLFFNSPGGSLDIEEAIVAIIDMSKTPVYGYALGMVASAASLIYIACHKRFMLPNAYFVIHKGSCNGIGGNYEEIQAFMEDYNKQVEKMQKFYIERTNYTEQEVRENIRTDWYIRREDAMKSGIAQEIITDIEVLL